MEDYYKALGVSLHAGKEEIREAYKEKAKIYNPDNEDTRKQFILINHAYEILTDDQKRIKYDQEYILSKQQDVTGVKRRKGATFSYLLNGALVFALIGVWYSNQNHNSVLEKRYGKLEQVYKDLKSTLSDVQDENITLTQKNSDLQSQLDKMPVVAASTSEETGADGIDIGVSQEDVRRIMGTPSSVTKLGSTEIWNYGLSSVTFSNSKVDGWRNFDNNLKLK
ncbi:J domain-containing protein [Neobacillus cucumis]|uniref:J domain-containing protein n=1 Tax=Neobacillus cucumis TaxID=1740721 RepID=UPI00203ABBA3|nr:J domain-containing protein [Neobacillus cucumis]MCM3724607.1 J domain-containing protein [Neobacillus cucumis]